MKKILASIVLMTFISGIISCTPQPINPPPQQGNLIGNWERVQGRVIYYKNGVIVDSSNFGQNSNAAHTMEIKADTLYRRITIVNNGDTNLQEIIYSYQHIGSSGLALILLENRASAVYPQNEELTYKFINGQLEITEIEDNIPAQQTNKVYDKVESIVLYDSIP